MTETSTALQQANVGADQHQDWQGLAASALDWWRDAGVDVLVEDAPRDWLTSIASVARVVPSEPIVESDLLPDTLQTFLAWRVGSTAPEHGWSGGWLSGAMAEGGETMVLADCPDREDGNAGLLSGPSGRLLDNMLAAIGLSRATVHIAAVCAKRPIAGRVPPEVAERLGKIARHHVALAAPKRLLLLGDAASRAVLGMTVRDAGGSLHQFNHRNGHTGVVASFHPRLLIERPVQKAQAWKDLRVLARHGGNDA